MIKSFFADKNGKLAIIDWPNVPLAVWIICSVLSRIITSNHISSGFSSLGTAAILVWAYLEITSGKSWFRRTVGAVVAIMVVVHMFR